MSASTRPGISPSPSPELSRNAAAARPDATSPAWAPPIPSATANTGGSQTYESSLCRRRRPGSVAAALLPSFKVVPQLGLADAQDVARRQPLRPRQPDAVQVRAVRRADVLDPDAVLAWLDPRMRRGRVLVGVELDVVLRAAAHGQRRRVELPLLALAERGAREHRELPRLDVRPGVAEARHRARGEHEALLRQRHVASGGAHDPPDEQVEQHQEGDLEDEQRLLHGDRGENQSRSRRRQSRRLRSSIPLPAAAKPRPLLSRGSVEPTPLMSSVEPTLIVTPLPSPAGRRARSSRP